MIIVDNALSLIEAIQSKEATSIGISRSFYLSEPIVLPPHVSFTGIKQENGELPILMFDGTDGVGITRGNQIRDIHIHTNDTNRAIFLASNEEDLETFTFRNIFLIGQFSFVMRPPTTKARVDIDGLDIQNTDARRYLEQPQKYGVNVLQGALTIYNFNSEKSTIIVNAKNISIGRKNIPVKGSGIFIAGFGDTGGTTVIENLEHQDIYSTGYIPYGVSTLITGGVFILNGAYAENILSHGTVVTYGVNDMVLDVWGTVKKWHLKQGVTSYGPSGVGFVNFGEVTHFEIAGPIETYGLGARGYNQYDGTLKEGYFKDIKTFGNGSVGIQVSKEIGNLTIDGNIETYGSIGNSLVKGKNISLPAYALSIKAGGSIQRLQINGSITTSGQQVVSYIVEDHGSVKNLSVTGEVLALGEGSVPVKIDGDSRTPLH